MSKRNQINLILKLVQVVFAFSILLAILDLYMNYRIPKIVAQQIGEVEQKIAVAIDSYIENNKTNLQDSASEVLDAKLSANTSFQGKLEIHLPTLKNLNLPGQTPIALQDTTQVVLYEFMDYQCGFCRRFYTSVKVTKDTYPDLQVKYIDYPILGNISVYSAEAALALSDQGLYMSMHESLMQHRGRLSQRVIDTIAKNVGADVPKLKTSLRKFDNVIRQNRQLANNFGVSGTPFSIIVSPNKDGKIVGEEINGYVTDKTLMAMVEKYKND